MAGEKCSEATTSNSSSRGGGGGSNSRSERGETVVTDFDWFGSSCVYCKAPNSNSFSHGLWAHSLTVDDYQDLLDRGWRRSGSFLYKSDMKRTCCPSYTIRLKADDFIPSKKLIRVQRKMERFLDGTLEMKGTGELQDRPCTSKVLCICNCHEVSSLGRHDSSLVDKEDKSKLEQFLHYLSDEIDRAVQICIGEGQLPSYLQLPKACVKAVSQPKRKKIAEGSEDLLYTSSIAFQIAAALRHAHSAIKDKEEPRPSAGCADNDNLPSDLQPQTIGEKLAFSLSQMGETSGLLVHACKGHLNFHSSSRQALPDIAGQVNSFTKDSPVRNGNKRRCLVKCCDCHQGKRRKLEVLLKRSSFDPEEFDLYRRYQLKVHNDKPDHVTESSYRRFLVDTPLVFVPSTGDGTVPPSGFGSFHQKYVVDGRLVAVGVVDILPKCLSSKYLFWDPDFAFLSLGKYSALQEISWVRENQVRCPSLQYYYLGYYIHSCSKMRYKAAYRPSDLLCPLRYQWVPFDIAKPLLDRNKYVVLSDYINLSPVNENAIELHHDESNHVDTNDPLIEEEDMVDSEHDDSDVEHSGEEDGEIDNVLIGLGGSHFRCKGAAFGPAEQLEAQLCWYRKLVGVQLSERMVYNHPCPDLFTQLDDDDLDSTPTHPIIFTEPVSVAESQIFKDGSNHSGDCFFLQFLLETHLFLSTYVVGGGLDGGVDFATSDGDAT